MWAEVDGLLEKALEAGLATGCALCVRVGDRELLVRERGLASVRPVRRAVVQRQPWDLASLTKVLCTTPVTLALAGQGQLDLDQPLRRVFPAAPPGVTAAHCLQHTSGLPAWRRLFDEVQAAGLAWGSAETRAWVASRVCETPLDHPPGVAHRYSDLGMLLLGAALEAATGARLDQLWSTLVGGPSGADLRWGWPNAAATEDCPVRGRVVVGEVHDLNAAVMGGIAPHAGLFGDVRAVAAAAAWQLRAWHGAREGLEPNLVREAWSRSGPGSHRLGWDGVTLGASSAGPRWPADGVGHLGFTGCSLWVAPRQRVVVAFLSNRVHPVIEGGAVPDAPVHPRYTAFKALRPALHTAVVDALTVGGLWSDAT